MRTWINPSNAVMKKKVFGLEISAWMHEIAYDVETCNIASQRCVCESRELRQSKWGGCFARISISHDSRDFQIFNLSSAGRSGEPNTREAGWPQGLAPSLERLCALCKELDSWLNGATHRVVVLHARYVTPYVMAWGEGWRTVERTLRGTGCSLCFST
jgi:hypothetical protein